MLLTTTENIPDKPYAVLGMVRGSTIQSKNIGHDITQSLKTIIGGELGAYTQMMEDARDIAVERMIADAQKLGADAIVALRLVSSSVMQGAAEVMAYGTAVKFL